MSEKKQKFDRVYIQIPERGYNIPQSERHNYDDLEGGIRTNHLNKIFDMGYKSFWQDSNCLVLPGKERIDTDTMGYSLIFKCEPKSKEEIVDDWEEILDDLVVFSFSLENSDTKERERIIP